MGIIVDGKLGEEYGITEEVCFSFPVIVDKDGNKTLMKKSNNLNDFFDFDFEFKKT